MNDVVSRRAFGSRMSRKRPFASLDERDVGILEYVSDGTAIGGTLKRLPEDFIVTEIDATGKPVALIGRSGVALTSEMAVSECVAERAAPDDGSDDDVGNDQTVESTHADSSYEPSFTRFVLRKERMDTLGVIAVLAEHFGVPVRSFGFAGLKDHRAITTQAMTVRGVPPSSVLAVSHPHLVIGCDAQHVDKPLKLGMLGGNRFRILVRDVRGTPNKLNASLSTLRRRGFINYYGLQRFGAARNDEVICFVCACPCAFLCTCASSRHDERLATSSPYYVVRRVRPRTIGVANR